MLKKIAKHTEEVGATSDREYKHQTAEPDPWGRQVVERSGADYKVSILIFLKK